MNAVIKPTPDPVSLGLLAISMVKGAQYLMGHRQQARRLSEIGIEHLPYVTVSKTPSGCYDVGGVKCACSICAAAYILAKYWN